MKKLIAFALTAVTSMTIAALTAPLGDVPASRADYENVPGGVLDLCVVNTSSNYVTYDKSLSVTRGDTLRIYTARYTELMSDLKGAGTLELYCGGERTFLGDQKGSSYAPWASFTGAVHVYPWTEVEKGAGWYGVILNHGGKRFSPETIEASLEVANSQLMRNKVYIHDGATLATPTGQRGVRIGELNTAPGSRIYGAIKKSTSTTPSASYIVVGAKNTDAVLAGEIRSCDDAGTPLGIIKEGTGTYRITGNDNIINGGVRVLSGAVMVNNDAAAAASGKLQGAIGHNPSNLPGIYVFEGATVGGTGSVASTVDLYGNLAPGDNGTGTLTLADYASDQRVSLRLRPTSKLYFDINSADDYDRLDVSGDLEWYPYDQNFNTSDNMPVVCLQLADDADLQVGDTFTLIRATGEVTFDGDIDRYFRIKYPSRYSWEAGSTYVNGRFTLTARVYSLDDNGHGDDDKPDDPNTPDDPYADDPDDGFDDTKDPATLRDYADRIGKHIGVAVSTWRVNGFDNPNTAQIKTMAQEFNALVAENEMKFESLQPSRGSFNFNDGDRIANMAEREGMYLRGHALAWHKQMPTWLSSDGGVKNNNNFSREELLQILEAHINRVVGHYKGKVKEWDVVNECLSDDQSAIRANPTAYDLRPSVWMTGIGEDYIDSAFVYAHRADPDALLILNEYDAEFKGVAKTEALYNLAKRLKDSGIPIHGVGLQCHLDAGKVDASKLAATFDMYAKIGLTCIITELDLGIDSTSAADYEQQAKDYGAIARVVARNDNCRGMVVWGFSDDQSWRSSHPLLYDNAHRRKSAYYAVHAALRRAAADSGIGDLPDDASDVVSTEYYDMLGHRVAYPTAGVYIVIQHLADGTYRSTKILK